MTLHFYTAKGGQGCTTTAVAAALTLGEARQATVTMGVFGYDAFAVAGVPHDENGGPIGRHVECAVFGHWSTDYTSYDIVDWGNQPVEPDWPGQRILVTRACFVALKRAVEQPVQPDKVVLIRESGRALTDRDVACAVAAPVIQIDWDPAIARAVDAGLLTARLPKAYGPILPQLT